MKSLHILPVSDVWDPEGLIRSPDIPLLIRYWELLDLVGLVRPSPTCGAQHSPVGHVWFTMVPFKTLSGQEWMRYSWFTRYEHLINYKNDVLYILWLLMKFETTYFKRYLPSSKGTLESIMREIFLFLWIDKILQIKNKLTSQDFTQSSFIISKFWIEKNWIFNILFEFNI